MTAVVELAIRRRGWQLLNIRYIAIRMSVLCQVPVFGASDW